MIAFLALLLVPNYMQAQVKSVTAGDSSIQIGGTTKNPTVAVGANGITNAHVGDSALNPAKIAGTAAILGSNHFTEDQAIATEDLGPALDVTNNSSGGVGIKASMSGNVADAIVAVCNGGLNTDCYGLSARGTSKGVLAEGNIAVQARATANNASGATGIGVDASSSSGLAGRFSTSTGDLLIGLKEGTKKFRVDGNGNVFASGYNVGGADFAESVEPSGSKDNYKQGDVVVIDPTAHRRVALARTPYSSLVAGIYSTNPGVVASPYFMDDPHLAREIPLAVVGIVPCHVSTENGPIRAGDLLVTSSTPGYAMKGTDHSRMLGAVLGKALEPLDSDKGVIQVLVTLQ